MLCSIFCIEENLNQDPCHKSHTSAKLILLLSHRARKRIRFGGLEMYILGFNNKHGKQDPARWRGSKVFGNSSRMREILCKILQEISLCLSYRLNLVSNFLHGQEHGKKLLREEYMRIRQFLVDIFFCLPRENSVFCLAQEGMICIGWSLKHFMSPRH